MSVDPVANNFALSLTSHAAHLERLAGAESPVLLLSLLLLPIIIFDNLTCSCVGKVAKICWKGRSWRVHIDDVELLSGVVREIINLCGESLDVDVSADSHAIEFLGNICNYLEAETKLDVRIHLITIEEKFEISV